MGVVFVLWLFSALRREEWPTTSTVVTYLVAFVAGAVLLHVFCYRQRPRSAAVVRRPSTQSDEGEPPKATADYVPLEVPIEALRPELSDGYADRSLSSFYVLTVTLRPKFTKSLRNASVEIAPVGARSYNILGLFRGANIQPHAWRTKSAVVAPVPILLPGESINLKLLVAANFGLEPAYRWFLHDASGAEIDVGEMSFRDYVEQRNRRMNSPARPF